MKKWKWFGKKTEAVFDYWSLGHMALYFALEKFWLHIYSLERAILIVIFIAYLWEIIERTAEDSAWWQKKFPGKECWHNRYIGDILANIIGFSAAVLL